LVQNHRFDPDLSINTATGDHVMEQTTEDITKEKLMADIRLVIADSEELLRATAGQAGDKIADLRAKSAEHLASAKVKLVELEGAMADKAKAVARATDDYVHDNPWKAVGIAAGIGLFAGLLIGRR
jgi:ElaB/YqjD/DUF883 family membrane-anchored ribosome-binding protein